MVINDKLLMEMYYGWKFIVFGLDGKLYVFVGVFCNICCFDENWYVNIMCMNVDGSGLELVVCGICNMVGFDWYLIMYELWFIDNGCDLMGDDVFDDELNCII